MVEWRGQQAPHAMPRGRVTRAAPLVGLAGRTAGEAVVAALRRRMGNGDSERFHRRTADRYADMLGRSKGVLMKAGQLLSFVTLGAAVPQEYRTIYQAALARLQADAPPMPPELAASMIEAELGSPPAKVFAEFDPQPLAAASIGQVHAARLEDGRRVAVKIQYPGVEEAIRADLENTELLATFFQMIRTLTPEIVRIDVRLLAQEVAERVREEIDYHVEAKNQSDFADAYRGHPFIRIPEVVPELSTRRVFTMELAEGLRWSEALLADAELRDRWGEAIFRFSLGSLYRLGLFNVDPHPGNYLFGLDGTVTFLDFGCVKRYTAEQNEMLWAIVRATVDGDAQALFSLFVDVGFLDLTDDGPNPAELLAWYQDSMRPVRQPQPFTYTPEWAAEVVRSEFSPFGPYREVTRRLKLPRNFVFLSRVNLGLSAVLGELRATANWAAIREEWESGGPPASQYGEQDLAFWNQRHDH